jgi:hypothetical protein
MALITPNMAIREVIPLTPADSHAQNGCDGTCCATTEDGGEICTLPSTRETALKADDEPRSSLWKRTRGVGMFAVACITSPCCTPLIVPVVLGMLAGTPAAAWMGTNLGWVFGGLTLISAGSLVLALRWMRTASSHQRPVTSKSI